MGSGHSKEDSKKESKRSSRHTSSRHSTSRPSSSRAGAHSSSSKSKSGSKSGSKSKSGSSSKSKSKSKSESKSSKDTSSRDPCAGLTPQAMQALRKDFLTNLSEPKFVAENHLIWGTLTRKQQKKCQMFQATFYDITEEEMNQFIDEWRREYPEEMDYGYNIEEDTLYPQEDQSPENALGIFQNAPNDAKDKGKGKEPMRRHSTGQHDAHLEPLQQIPPRPVTPPVTGLIPEDYAKIRETLRWVNGVAFSSKPSTAEHSSSKHSSSKHSSSKHSYSKHSSSKRSSEPSSKHSSSKHSSSKHATSSSSKPSTSKASSSKHSSSKHSSSKSSGKDGSRSHKSSSSRY